MLEKIQIEKRATKHQRLILKLKSHGMGNSIINLEQWLTDRRQRVVDGEELEISLEWGATRICTRAYFISGLHQ